MTQVNLAAAQSPTQGILDFDEGFPIKVVQLTFDDAKQVLFGANYETNRVGDDSHIEDVADMIVNNQWIGHTKLTFAIHKGELVLVDGQHRLRAFMSACAQGYEGTFPAIFEFVSEPAANVAYALLDTAQKKRSPAVIAKALGFAIAEENLLKHSLSAGKYAIKYAGLTSDRTMTVYDDNGVASTKVMKNRVSYRGITEDWVRDRLAEFNSFASVVKAGGTRDARIAKVLSSARVLPVVIETLAADHDRAMGLWTQIIVSKYPGTELSDATREKLLEEAPRTTSCRVTEKARFAGEAWNTLLEKGDDVEPKFVRTRGDNSPRDVTLAGCSYRGNDIVVLA